MTTVQLAIRSALEGKKASVERAASHDMQHWGRGVCDNLTSLTDQKSCLHALHIILVEKQICAASQCTAGSWTLDYLSTKKHAPSDMRVALKYVRRLDTIKHPMKKHPMVTFRSMLNYGKNDCVVVT